MALDDSVNHGKTEASAALSFGGEKWFEATLFNFFGHANPVIAQAQKRLTSLDRNFDGDAAAVRHRVYRVEDQVGQYFA